MWFRYCFLITFVQFIFAIKHHHHHHNHQRQHTAVIDNNVYFLISTSTKIYCLKTQFNHNQQLHMQSDEKLNSNFDSISNNNYEVIYEELNSTNNWITDLDYNSIDNIIYVNVYDSLTFKSDIVQLIYNKNTNKWLKYYLYRNQMHALGLTFNQYKRELYWTSAKSIYVASIPLSSVTAKLADEPYHNETYFNLKYNPFQFHLSLDSMPPRVLFSLELTKKLLYLKYDHVNEAIYVSTLNYIYACFFKNSKCAILVSNMQSARGIYFDELNRYLYTVDHKRKQIDRIRLDTNLIEKYFTSNEESNIISENNALNVTSILNSQLMPDLGDIFYVCLYKEHLLWTEFSGKLKSINVNTINNYDILFTTNEYTYAIVLLNNATKSSTTSNKITTTTTTITDTNDSNLIDMMSFESNEKSDLYDYADLVSLGQAKEGTTVLTTSATTTSVRPSTTTTRRLTTTVPTTTSTVIVSSTTTTISEYTSSIGHSTDSSDTSVDTSPESTDVFLTKNNQLSTETSKITEIIDENDDIETLSSSPSSSTSISTTITLISESEPSVINDVPITTTNLIIEATSTSISKTEKLIINQNESTQKVLNTINDENDEDENDDDDNENNSSIVSNETKVIKSLLSTLKMSSIPFDSETSTSTQVAVHLKKQKLTNKNDKIGDASSTNTIKITDDETYKYTPIKIAKHDTITHATPTLNIILYVISCLLCFSLILNASLFYLTKFRNKSRGKLILNNHDLCDSSDHQTMKSDEIADLN